MGAVIHQIAMTLENIEAKVLLLPKQSQVTLLTRMLDRLGQSNEIDQEIASVWVEEAELRDRAIDDGQVWGN
jgi:hypothetical protein